MLYPAQAFFTQPSLIKLQHANQAVDLIPNLCTIHALSFFLVPLLALSLYNYYFQTLQFHIALVNMVKFAFNINLFSLFQGLYMSIQAITNFMRTE